MRVLLIVLLGLGLGACQLIYKLPTRQGNVIEQKQLDKLETGMTRDQVRFLLGTPIAASPFNDERWDYVGYYKSPRGKTSSRIVSIYFSGDKVSRLDGIKTGADEEVSKLETPDAKTVIKEEKKEKAEEERAKGDAELGDSIFAPDPNRPDAPDASKLPNP